MPFPGCFSCVSLLGASASEPRLHGLHAAALGLHRAAHEAALRPAALECRGPAEAEAEGEGHETGADAQGSVAVGPGLRRSGPFLDIYIYCIILLYTYHTYILYYIKYIILYYMVLYHIILYIKLCMF